jgi:hypothetical protein
MNSFSHPLFAYLCQLSQPISKIFTFLGAVKPHSTFLTGVRDNVTAYTPAMVFRGLQEDVNTVRHYQHQVNLQNNSVQSAELSTLVTDYRW